MLQQAAAQSNAELLQQTWQALQPFYSYILLGLTQGRMAVANVSSSSSSISSSLPAVLTSQLVRLACGYEQLAVLLLPFLLQHVVFAPTSNQSHRWVFAAAQNGTNRSMFVHSTVDCSKTC